MRHQKAYKKLNRTPSHRKALLRNMAGSLIEHERIITTLPKAKMLRPFIEKLITLARRDNLHARRLAAKKLYGRVVLRKLFDDIAKHYAERAGGYTRIIKMGFRRGDNAPRAIIAFVDREIKEKPTLKEEKSDDKA